MKEINVEELKTIQLDILNKIHKFCLANHIRYSLAFGTLIGAIRHKGYIPWDDDIDIVMPRPDYNRFLQLFQNAYDDLEINAPEIDLNFYAPYANVFSNKMVLFEGDISVHRGIEMGIKIDIFPIDGIPRNSTIFYLKQKILYMLWCSLRYKMKYKTLSKRIIGCCFKVIAVFIGYKNIQRLILNFARKHPFDKYEYSDYIVFSTLKHKPVPRKVYDNYILLEFEGYKFMAVSEYDTVLTAIYGDYMQLPPVEQRVMHHNFKAYWK